MISLRYLLTAVFLLCLIPFANADLVWPEPNGMPVLQTQHTRLETTIGSDGDGNTLIVWGDHRSGDRNLFGQLINSNQQPQWQEDGRPLVTAAGFQAARSIISTEDGWIMLWLDSREFGGRCGSAPHVNDLYMQKFDHNGSPMWAADDLLVIDCDFSTDDEDFALLSDGNNGAFILWIIDELDDKHLKAKHILADGSWDPVWPEDGIVLEDAYANNRGPLDDLKAVPTAGGGFIAGWFSKLTPASREIKAQAVNMAGETLWGDDSGLLAATPYGGGADELTMCDDGLGGVFFAWQGGTGQDSIYLQRVNEDGTLAWGSLFGQQLPVEVTNEPEPYLVPSTDNTAIIIWENRESENRFVKAQRVSGEVNLQVHWDTDADLLSEGVDDLTTVTDGAGGVVVGMTHGQREITVEHVDVNGNLLTTEPFDDFQHYGSSLCAVRSDVSTVSFSFFYQPGKTTVNHQAYDFNTDSYLLPQGGENLTTGEHVSPDDIASAVTDNTLFLAMTDDRTAPFGPIPVLQAIDYQSGEQLFGEWGLSIVPGLSFDDEDPLDFSAGGIAVDATGDGEVVVVSLCHWQAFPWRSAVLQKVNSDGDLIWGDTGAVFSIDDYYLDGNDYLVFGTSDGGAVLFFQYLNTDFWQKIGVQRFDASGQPLWSDDTHNFISLSDDAELDNDRIIEVDQLSDGSFLVSYQGYGEIMMYAQRISMDGDLVWDQPIQISPEGYRIHRTEVLDDNLFVIFRSYLDGDITALYGQMISPDGELLWETDLRTIIEVDEGELSLNITVEVAGNDSFWLLYLVEFDDSERLCAQRFSSDGIPQIEPAEGITLYEGFSYFYYSNDAIEVLPDNSLYVCWSIGYPEDDDFFYTNLFYNRILPDGTFPEGYSGDPLTLSAGIHYQHEPYLVSDGDGGAYVYWKDSRGTQYHYNTYGLYAQRLNDGFTGIDEPSPATPDEWVLQAAYPNPFNATTRITIDLIASAEMQVKLFDILGREVMTIANERLTPGRHNLTVDASTLASGMYFLSVEQIGGAKRLQKLVVLK
jgi:Secretion system C-terminal sorting domain